MRTRVIFIASPQPWRGFVRSWLLGLGLWAFVPTVSAEPALAPAALSVVTYDERGNPVLVRDGDTVRSRQALTVTVTLQGPAYVRLAHIGPDGEVTVLRESRLCEELRSPDEEDCDASVSLALDEETGQETFLLLVSAEPLPALTCATVAAFDPRQATCSMEEPSLLTQTTPDMAAVGRSAQCPPGEPAAPRASSSWPVVRRARESYRGADLVSDWAFRRVGAVTFASVTVLHVP